MCPSEKINIKTRQEWRDLGFYYDRNDEEQRWEFLGSLDGLRRLPKFLLQYVNKPTHTNLGEHEHYGPYMHLEITTAGEPGIDSHCIYGSLSDLKRLADLIDEKLKDLNVGDQATIKFEYTPHAEYSLHFEVQGDDFDPASADLNSQ